MRSMPALTATIINAGCLHESAERGDEIAGTRCQYAKINEGEGRVKSLGLGEPRPAGEPHWQMCCPRLKTHQWN